MITKEFSIIFTKKKFSLRFIELSRFVSELDHFEVNLSNEICHHVKSNLYLTPPNNQCFLSHVDPYDVFIVQIAGKKEWFFGDIEPGYKRSGSDKVSTSPTILEAGDVLYLPANMIHMAKGLDETSLHITVALRPLSIEQYMNYLFDNKIVKDILKKPLPLSFDLAKIEESHLQDALKAVFALAKNLGQSDKGSQNFISRKLNPLQTFKFPIDLK